MDDLISRQAAIDVVRAYLSDCCVEDGDYHASGIEYELNDLPSAQPDKEKISDALYHMYMTACPFTSAEGVAAIKYYIREIYREIYGEEGPGWMKK